MTSTNDGKDVKSNQTSGHKGKSYYIELYKSLEKALNGESSIEARTPHVCEAWRRVYSLYQHSAPSTHPHLLSWLQRHTAHTVLQSKWAESKNEHARLAAAIDALVAEATAASAGREPHPWEQLLLQRAAWFRKTLGNPWGHPVLTSLINPNGDPVTDQQVLEWLIEERGIVLVTRLRQLVSAGNCDDLALLLASAVMDRARAACPPRADHAADDRVEEEEDSTSFVAVLEREASFTVDVWELLTDIELVLLLKTDKRPRCIELAKLAPLRHGYAMVERLRNRLATSPRDKKLWKHAKEVATIVTQVIIARCMVLTTCSGVGRAALYCCARSLARLVPTARLPAVSNTLATPAHTARHLHTFCAALHAQCSEEMKPFICELYVRAITAGMNELEQLKLNADKATEARAMEQTLASWFTQLGALLAGSARLRAECALTAFSVHPARAHYERVAATPPPAPLALPQDPTPDTKESSSDFGSWANDSRTQSNLVKTSETLQLKKTDQHQANVLSIAILTEGETLGLETELCQDLAVLLSGPRVKTLSWDMDRDVLLENCRVYMERTDGGTRAVTTELKYLNLDPAAYRHLPEEGDDESDLYYGIEKGYEHEVQFEDPEEIWQNAFFDPEQTESANDSEVEEAIQKKVRAPVHSSEDDEDPLSTIADAKREKKKLAKEKKERRRQKSHKRDTSKDGKRERRKDKEKKTKKESKKDKSEQTTGSLTSLLGMKVTKIPSQVPDGQKKVRKKKVRRRDSMFSYVSVTDSDFDGQVKSQISSSDPNIVVDGIFSMDELKSPERRLSDDGQKPIDNTKTTLAKSDSVQSPVIKDIKSRTVVSSRVTTSSDSDTSRAKSPYLTPNQRGNKHVISKKVKSSIMSKLLKFRWSRPQARPPPRVPTPSPSPAPTRGVSDAKQIPNQALVGMKIYNPEEIPKVYTNKKQNLEATKNEMNNLVNTPHAETSDIANHTPKIPFNDLPADKLQSSQNVLNVQKPSRQYSNVTRDIIQNVFNESYKNSEYLQQSPIKSVQQSICGTSQVPSVIHTNYTSPTKSDSKPHVLNLSPPKPTMAHQPFHKSMQNLSTDKIKHDVPKKPLLINDPNYFSQQHSKSASQVSPRIISNTCIKPPSQTAINTQQYDVNVIKEDLIKSSQRHTEIKRINMAKAAQNLTNQIANLKSDLIKYEQKKLSSSMQNVNAASGSCNNVKRHIFTPSDMLHGNSSQSKMYSGKSDDSYTSPACHSNNSSSASRCIPIQDMKSRQNAQTPKTVTGLNSHYQDFFKELAKTIKAGSKDPGKNVTIALNKEVKVTPVLPSVSSKKPNPVTPQCAKQTIQQKKPENAPNTFSRLSYMHKNKLNENKVNINDSLNMELNKNILEHKICKAKYFNNEVTISRVGATQANVQDQKNVIRKNEQTSLKLQKSCPILTGMLDSPVKTCQTTIQSSSDNQTDRDHADLLLLLRHQPVLKSNPKFSLTLTSTSDSTTTQTFNNTPTKVDTGMHHTLVGTKVKNINAILGDTTAVNQECMSENNKPQEWEQVMNDIQALKTEPLGPNALDMVLKKDYKRQTLINSRPHTSQKSDKITGHSTPKNKPSESKRREHSTSSSSSSRKPSTEKHSEILKSHRKTENIKKPSSTETQKRLEGHSKHNSNTSKTDDPFISGIPNSAYDMLGDLMDDDLRQELGELSSDEEAYNAPNVPVTKVKHNTNIPKTSTACNVPNVAKEEPHIVAPKTVVCMNESTSNLICRTIKNTHSTVGYTNVIASNTSHIDAARLPESRPNIVCSNPEQPHTAAVITNQIIQHTGNNFITNHNNIDPSCFMGSIEPSNVIIASVPLPVPAQPVVVIRQDLVYDPYPTIHIHETQVTAGLCSVNQNVYTINNTPNIAVYQTTQFAAPVINPVIIGSAMTTTNVSNSVAMAEPQISPDTTNVDVNTQEPDSTNLAITDRLVEDDNNPEVKTTKLDFNMNRNCERKVLSQVQEKHPTESVANDLVVRRLSAVDDLVQTKQDEERIKLKRQTLMNRKISHACFHPPIPLAYTPLSKNVNFGKILQQDTLKNGIIMPNQKVLPNTANGINKYVSVTTSDKDVGANNENIESTEQSSRAKDIQKTCRRISLRSSKISDRKVSPDKQTKIRLNRNKIKLKISDTFIEKITNIGNENKESVKTPTRISSRILNKKKLNTSDSNKPLSSTETQNCIANNELIDFEEELSGSKILKTTLPTSGEVMKKESECENNKPGDISINEHGKSECKIEAVPTFESKKPIQNSLEPTVVIEKLKNNLGDQILIKSLPPKTPAKEPKDEAIKIVNRTLRSKIISKDLLSVNVKDAPKNAGSEKSDLSIPLENTDRVPIASPVVILDKTMMKSTIVHEQKVTKQTETTDFASKQTHGTDLPPCDRVMHELEAENNRAPALRINRAPLNVKETLPTSENLANKVVTHIDTSRTMVQNISSLPSDETQSNPARQTEQTVPLQPQLNIVNINPALTERNEKVAVQNKPFTDTEIISASKLPNKPRLNEVNTVIQNRPSLPKDNSLKVNSSDPKITVPMHPLVTINTKPTQIGQKFQDIVEQTPQTSNDTKSIPTAKIVLSSTDSSLLHKTEKLNKVDPKVTTPLHEVMPKGTSSTKDKSEEVKETDFKSTVSLLSSKTLPVEIAPRLVNNDANPPGTHKTLPALETVSTNVNPKDVHTMVRKEVRVPIAQKDLQQVVKQREVNSLQKTEETNPDSILKINSPGDIENKDEQITSDPVRSLLCDKNIIEIPDEVTLTQSNANHCKRDEQEKAAIKKNNTIKMNDSTAHYVQKKDAPITGNKKQEGTRIIMKGDVKIEELPVVGGEDSDKKLLRITLPNGKVFKATIFGNIQGDFDSLFSDPTMKSLLAGGIKDGRRYTVNYKQISKANKNNPSKILDTTIQGMNIKEADLPVDTVNLISDDEEEIESRSFITEFGKYRTHVDQETYTKHQRKFYQKCVVKLCRENIFKSNKTKPKSYPSLNTSLLTRTKSKLLSDVASVSDVSHEILSKTENNLPAVTIDSTDKTATKQETLQTPLLELASDTVKIPDVIEIDDSSNDSVDDLDTNSGKIENVEPVEKIIELKNLLLQDLGVEALTDTEKNITLPVKNKPAVDDLKNALLQDLGVVTEDSPIIDITENDEEDENVTAENAIPNITSNCKEKKGSEIQMQDIIKDCVIRITKCESLIKRYELMKTMKKCYVKLERLNDSVFDMSRLELNDESNNKETCESNQENGEEFIEFDVEETFSSPQLSRYPSLSILNNWDDVCQPVPDSPCCSSPVMEIYDTIVQLRTTVMGTTELLLGPHNNTFSCDSEWRLTKSKCRTPEILKLSCRPETEDKEHTVILSHCDSIVNDDHELPLTSKTPKLSAIILKFLEDNPDVIHQLKFMREMRTVSKSSSPSNKLKRKTEESVKNTVASKILKLGTLALNTFNSCIAVAIPAPDSEQGLVINSIDKCIPIEVVNKHEVMTSGSEKVEKVVDPINIESNLSNKSDKSEMDLKERRECSEDILNSSYESGLVDEETDTCSKETCNDIYDNKTSPVYIGTEALCNNKTDPITQVPSDVNNLFSSACVVNSNMTNVEIYMATCDLEKVSVYENTNIPDDAIQNELMDHRIENKEEKEVDCNESDRFAETSVNSPTQDPPVNNQMESQLIERSETLQPGDVTNVVRVVVEDVLDKICQTVLQSPDGEIHSKNRDGSKLYATQVCDTTKDESEGSMNIKETTLLNSATLTNDEGTPDTHNDILHLDGEKLNTNTIAEAKTTIETNSKVIEPLTIQETNDCTSKGQDFQTENNEESKDGNKETSLQSKTSYTETINQETQMSSDNSHECNEMEVSNILNMDGIERYEIPIEHLSLNKIYEVEIIDTPLEDADSGAISAVTLSESRSEPVTGNNVNLLEEMQSNDSEIKSPVFIDSKEIAFNYHDYTKRPKKQQDTTIDSANEEYGDELDETHDRNSINEKNAIINSVHNGHLTLSLDLKCNQCPEKASTEASEIEVNSLNENFSLKSDTKCKYELIQDDDWLTVIKTENGKDDNDGSVEFVGTNDVIKEKPIVASLCSKNTTINIKGFEYDDVYIFPLSESGSSNTSSDSLGQELNSDVLKCDNLQDDIHDIDYSVIAPKVTYSRKCLKRKIDMRDSKVSEKKYRKGKNIDCPKLTVTSMAESAYSKEYKRLLEYCSSVKFSYSRPFHKECVEVDDLTNNWPINSTFNDVPGDVTDEHLFTNCQKTDRFQPDPTTQTLAEEISCQYENSDATQGNPCNEASEENFNMGFGEGSGRVIQILKKGGESNISAATLSDVKQSQPVFKSVDLHDINDLKTNSDDQIKKICQHLNFLELRDKVRSFFKKSSVELKSDWLQENIKDADFKSRFHADEFPFDFCSLNYVKPIPIEAIVQVVQVGQLPVSAAAQNPVTCDPRVTQVSDASPSQCSVDNSPNDDSQSEIKTEYTELTTADLTIPLQEYAQQNQASMNLASHDTNIELTEQTISLEMEIKAEESPEIKEEMPDIKEEKSNSSDTELHTLTNATHGNENYLFEHNTEKSDARSVIYDSSEQNSSETFSLQRQQNGTSEKTDQIAHAMNAAGITTSPETITNTRAHALVNILSQKIRQGSVNNTQTATNTYSKTTSINAMALQQALAQILPPPLNQTGSSDNNQTQSTPVGPQVLHIVQGKNASGNQITLVDNSQQSVISTPNATQVLHIVQNKSATSGQASNGTLTPQSNSFSGLSLVDAGLQQGGNQLLHIVNTGNQKTASPGQLLKRVNLLTNLTNVQGSNEQKMVQFVCKSADGKAIQLNAPHQRSMVLRLQPIETSNVQTPPAKPAESQELSPSTTSSAASKDSASQQEIKSRSIYEENYAKFIQNSSTKTPGLEKSTSLPKFNQAFGKPVFQEGSQKQGDAANNNSHLPPVNTNTENSECPVTENAINLEHIGQISSPPLLLRKQPAVTTQSQPNIVQQIKQTIAPMNIQTMHGGVIYTRQIPVNIGGGQTINLITVPSTELINEETPKTQTSQGDIEPSIIKIVPQSQTNTNTESTQEESNNHARGSNESTPTPQPQPVLTQMRIKLPMLSKAPQMVPGARVVRPSFFQIQRNVIGGANQPVYQQLVLTAAPPLGQQTIRLPQAQTSRPIKVSSENQSSSSESQMSSSTLEQLREFDMVLEQVKERSTVQPTTNSTNNSSFKIHTSSSDTTDGNASSNCSTESTSQVLYSIGNNQSLNVAYVSRKTTVTTPTTSTYVRSPDSSGIADSPSSSTHVQLPHTVTTDSSPTEMSSQSKPAKVGSKSKSRPKSTSNPPNTLKLNSIPPKTSSQKPLEDEQTTQRILYILAEYKEQVENSPDKDKPAPRRRSNPPSNPGSSKRKKSSSSRRSGTREMSPVHGEDTCRTMGSEDSSCGTSQGDCTESCLDSHSPQDSPRKVARKITFDQDLTVTQPRPQAQRNVIVADGQTITVARGTTGKPATAVLMPANYILPVSMVKGGQQIAIVTNRGPKLLTVGGEGGATNALLLQRLIGPAGLKPVLARPGVRHVRLPTAALHNLQAFNLATATTVQPPDSTASPTSGPTPPELSDTRANSSPWTDRDDVKPERGSSPEGSEPWNLPSSADPHEYTYEETVRTDNMDRTVLDPIPDRYSPDMEAQRIFDKMFDVDSKKSYAVDSQDNSPRCAYDIDPSDCDDKPYQVVQKKDGSQRQHRLSHVSAAALRHKYAILEHELRLQKSLSEECEDLGVDSPSASELFPEAELLFAASPAHEHNHDAHHSHTPQPHQSSTIPQPDMDDQIATDHLIPREIDVSLGLGDVGIVAVSDDGMQATIALDQEEFARSHPNTTFHSEPTEGEVQPFTITGLKGRHITSTIFHSNSAPATVLMAAPQATVISQAPDHGVKYEIENMMNSMPSSHNNDMNLSSVLVKDDGLTRFDSILTDSRELHLTNTASAIVHSSGNATQVIRRVCYEDDKRERDARYLIDEPDNLIAGDDAKMIAEDSSRDATLESMADVDDDRSSPERHAELFWESNSASERSESRRPLDFSSDSDKCCKSPSYDETNSTDSSGVGTRVRLDSVIKEARGRERSGSADGSSADDTHPPLRTYPPKRLYHPEGEVERSLSGKTRAGERSPDSLEVRRRASGRGVVKRGCHCCNGSPAPPRPKKPRQRKPTLDFNTNT